MRPIVKGIAIAGFAVALIAVGLAPAGAMPKHTGAKLRLAVSPKKATVGRPTKFRFHATTRHGRPVAGARIRFAGRRTTTGRHGRAYIITTLHRSGRFTARVTKHGFHTGRRRVVAHAGSGGGPTGPSTFDGDCQVDGSVSFNPPLTGTPQSIDQHARASGTCSGTFTDPRGRTHHANDAPVTFDETSHADNASCGGGVATGGGTLTFPWGQIKFTFDETRGGAVAIFTLTGAKGGSAKGGAVASPGSDPTLPLQQCGGAGLKEAGIQGFASTTPEISG